MQADKLQESAPLISSRPVAPKSHVTRRSILAFGCVALVLCVVFSGAIVNWVRFAVSKERNTYLLLVPIVTAYLIRTCRKHLRREFTTSPFAALVPVVIGASALVFGRFVADPIDLLSLRIFALLNFLLAGAFVFFGKQLLRQITFPIAFLIFAVPVAPTLVGHIEIFLQYTSAEAAYWLMSLVGIPMIREGINFRLPNIYIQVAQECSGYNSTFTLFMVSTVAGYMFLKSHSKRAILSLAVIPLAILRNGFRVTTLAALCVYVDPKLIDSDIHHKGGPLFFALSLIPFFLILWALRKSESRRDRKDRTKQT
jgi:exosortase C (VPDSG-CTERM-specific)